MATKRKRLEQLTERQLQIMDVIWQAGRATVADVHLALRRARLARKTIATLLARMEEQRLVAHTTDGREFVYSALITREQVARAKLRSMVDFVLNGDTEPLIRYALEEKDVSPGDIERVEAMLAQFDAKQQGA